VHSLGNEGFGTVGEGCFVGERFCFFFEMYGFPRSRKSASVSLWEDGETGCGFLCDFGEILDVGICAAIGDILECVLPCTRSRNTARAILPTDDRLLFVTFKYNFYIFVILSVVV
jgi:hypothetical protein